MAEFTIKKAVIEDANQIAGLLKELGYPNTSAFAQSKIAELSKSDNDTVLIAEINDRIIGVAHLHIAELFHEPGRLGRVMAIVVTSNYRQSGVGQKLITSLETIARNAGCTKMEITSGIHRDGAHTFYKKLGYTEKPRRFGKVFKGK